MNLNWKQNSYMGNSELRAIGNIVMRLETINVDVIKSRLE